MEKGAAVGSVAKSAALSAKVFAASALTLMATKNRKYSRDFRPIMGLIEEGKKRRKEVEERRMWKSWYVNQMDFFL